ncbi:putative DnaJ domain protein [Desulfosarcina cetonica]|uniref:J domain-containing protein n=1 Tax=Desulfosarcina cetonica TaxID=90730 RepID=UPI0006CF2FE9|nr:J domain-containing protein [Desulfosarcina cetonica]VTR64922.1 putative DnaJ domain protein [Desulfosarcina cetonica]
MYLARIPDRALGYRYLIRQSYADTTCYRSRDLFDLGQDPARFIHYPGGNGFYIDDLVLETIGERGVPVTQAEIEAVFLPFIDPQIRRVIDAFDRGSRHRERAKDTCMPKERFHPFDRYRLLCLKLGRVNARAMGCMPDHLYANLQEKSRDEIEYDFIAAERILKPHELAHYTYQIFDLQSCFTESFARSHPEVLDQEQMDRFFIDRLCRLNRDDIFWSGCQRSSHLHPHLVRYALMYFDHTFPVRDPTHAFFQDFMNRHRLHRPPQSVQLSLAESASLFGVTVEVLKRMDCRSLTRQYRKLAKQHHPDKGGSPEQFVRLTAAYQKLVRRKSRM